MDDETAVSEHVQVENVPLLLDEHKERNFQSTIKTLNFYQDRRPENFTGLMTAALNDAVVRPGEAPITVDDLSSLEYFEADSMSASELAGQRIVRPVFVISDERQFDKLFNRFAEADPGSTAAFYLNVPNEDKPVNNIVGAAIRQSGVIISRSKNPDDLGHEVRHTIEANKYQGFNRLLSEAFAYATDHLEDAEKFKEVLQRYYEQFSQEEKVSDKAKVISGAGVSPRFGTYEKNEEWYKGLVGKVVDKVSQRSKEIGRINAQREITNSNNLEEYLK